MFLLKKELPRDTDEEGPLGAAARPAQPQEQTLKVSWGSTCGALNPWVNLGGGNAKAGRLPGDGALECLTRAVCQHSEDQSGVPCSRSPSFRPGCGFRSRGCQASPSFVSGRPAVDLGSALSCLELPLLGTCIWMGCLIQKSQGEGNVCLGVGTYNRMINVICRDVQGESCKMLICSIPDESQSFQLSVSSSILETLGI